MSGNDRSTEQLTAVTECRDLARSAEVAQELPELDAAHEFGLEHDMWRRLASFAAGGVLVVGAVAALHNLYRSGDGAADLISWSGLLLFALTALGGGIKLAMWGARPVIAALFDGAKERLAEPVLAVVASGAVIVGALGMWWTFRGGYASWWRDLTGESQWSLSLGIGQMLVAVLAGAGLFTGGQYLTGLVKEVLTDSGLLVERDRAAGKRRAPEGLWHPGLVAALVGGGLGLVLLTAGITPRLYVWITGAEVLPAVAAIAAVLTWAIGSNLGWWKGLAGLWKWATDASHKAAATSGVIALLMFSAGGLGLGWFTPATVPQAHAQCPPDCGGGSNGSNSYGPDASQFQPPQMPNQMPDYQGGNYGSNQAPLDQNSGISIYNTQAPSVSNNGVQGSSGQQGPQQGWDQPAHGTQIPDYQNATPYTQGPGKPNPDFNGGQANPGSQGGQSNQGVQQPAQQPQQAPEQPSQQDAGQQPNQSSDQQKIDDLARQLQDQQQQSTQDRQRIDDMTRQLQQGQQKQNGNQKLPKFPSKDKKKDDQHDRDKQSGDNDLTALLMGAASTRRRKQDKQEQSPDTQALGQDASQAVQGLPGDVQTYVQSGQQIGESSGSAAQGFGSAAQAGASLASSAQSGAVNPQDAITVVQGVSQGIQGTADAINAGSQIVKTAQGDADQVAQAVSDADPQLKPQAEQFTQLNDTVSKGTEGVGQVASGVSQVSGAVNSVSSMGSGGVPDSSGSSGDLLSEGGTATAVDFKTAPAPDPLPAPLQPSIPTTPSSVPHLSSPPASPGPAPEPPAPTTAPTPTPTQPTQPPAPTTPPNTPAPEPTSSPTPTPSPSTPPPPPPEAAKSNNPAEVAKQYLGKWANDLANNSDLQMQKGIDPTVDCANFASAVLIKAGLLDPSSQTVGVLPLYKTLTANGWQAVPAAEAPPGAVAIFGSAHSQHVEFVSANDAGKLTLIGSNNTGPGGEGPQKVGFEAPWSSAITYLKPPA
ncbi:YIP1 family protein [Mycobacteroides franklinii]|uniref:YIP1 family protein n=1 Tax=Mycobacteroides franklinii TaxID=948102 RepID=UPI003013FE20